MISDRDLNSNENTDEYFKAMDDEIQSLMRRDKWEIVSNKSVADHNMLPGTWSLKCNSKYDYRIRKFKAQYCVRGDIQKILSPKPLNLYSPVVQRATVRLMLILQFILGFKVKVLISHMPLLRQIFQVGRQF